MGKKSPHPVVFTVEHIKPHHLTGAIKLLGIPGGAEAVFADRGVAAIEAVRTQEIPYNENIENLKRS